ncbi:MAG: amidase, partial [Bacteroidetes bacterium]|nr:amidase [Bacteroidota bacterium]
MYISKNFLSESIDALKNKKISLIEYINLLCDRIDKTDPFVKALLPENNRRERLIKEAEELKKTFPDINKRPPLFGIPIGVKDIFRVDGFETSAGSKLPSKLFKGAESSVVTTLKKAGALILGKTVTTEFAYFEPGPTCNPHNINHTPGGSSSGSAAVVACGYTPLALGTQTIGSITRPASFCGVYGFKPSYSRIATDGVIPFSESADHVGFFTQDLEGIKITASLLCNNWRNNILISEKLPVIGVASEKYLEQADDEVRNFFEKNLELLEKTGFKIIRVDVFEDIEKLNITHKKMTAADFYNVHKIWFAQYENLYRESTRKLILEGKEVSAETFYNAREERG